MKRILFISTVSVFVAGFTANASRAQAGGLDNKVVICHLPPGNPDNAHTIVVGSSAVPAHLDHGDYLGECDVVPTVLPL